MFCFVVEVFYDLNSSVILKSFFFFLCVHIFFFIHEVFCVLPSVYIHRWRETLLLLYANASHWHKSFQLANVHTHTTYIKEINISDFFCYFLCLLFVHNLHPVGSSLLLLFEVEYKAEINFSTSIFAFYYKFLRVTNNITMLPKKEIIFWKK